MGNAQQEIDYDPLRNSAGKRISETDRKVRH